jgi:hypothetical protein
LVTGYKALAAGRWSLDFLLWQNHFLTTDGQDLRGWAEKRRAMLGQAKLALCFQIPSQASLHEILKPHRPFCYANGPTMLRQKSFGKNTGLRLVSKRGWVVKKHPQARL